MSGQPQIVVEGVCHTYRPPRGKPVLALDNVSLTVGTRASAAQDFSLSLSVKKTGDNLSVTWNRGSPVVRSAQKGLLEIDDGGYTKPVVLDAAQLQNGSLIYRNASQSVRFRLTVYPQARLGVVETLEWKQ